MLQREEESERNGEQERREREMSGGEKSEAGGRALNEGENEAI